MLGCFETGWVITVISGVFAAVDLGNGRRYDPTYC